MAIEHPKQVELLAPAGDWEAMRAAVSNGADAVYFGLSNFNARHRAANFGLERLPEVMEYLHSHNVRGYVTLNTLIFSDELAEAAEFVRQTARAGADGIIVQDLGLAKLIHELAPTLPMHGSTQMTLTESRGIEFVSRLGIQRVILARELSMAEIQQISETTRVQLEVFVHGALCVAYSGQCLTSESLGGRSANRGQCAQACRLPYDLIVDGRQRDMEDKAYLLSPQDLAAHELIGELTKLGVRAFKIEGRLKSAHYVAAATQTYRAAVDAAIAGKGFRISPQQREDLEQSFSRGFTHGFLDGVDHQALVHARFPKARGVRIGTVAGKTARGLLVKTEGGALKVGDGVVFDEGHPEQDEQGGRVTEVAGKGNGEIELVFHRGDVQLEAVMPGAIVWKTDDPIIRKRLGQSYSRDVVARREKLDFVVLAAAGAKLALTARDACGREATIESEELMQLAEKFPVTVEVLRKQLGRLGNTPFELGDVRLIGGGVMAPKSILNDLRRQAVEAIMRQRDRGHRVSDTDVLGELRRLSVAACPSPTDERPVQLAALVRTMEQLTAVLEWPGKVGMVYCDFEDVRRYKVAVGAAREKGIPIAPATLRVVKPGEEGLLRQIADCGPDAVLVRNLASLSYYAERGIPMIGDYSLNVANELTAGVLAAEGVERMTPSYDLNWRQMAAMLKQFPASLFEVVVHQHMPMFHMRHCVFAHTLSDGTNHRSCGRPCDSHRVELRDRVGQAHPLMADVACRNTVFNATAQSAAEYVPEMKRLGVKWFRVEMLRERGAEVGNLLDEYAKVLAGVEEGKRAIRQLRVLNQLGVTRGTLDYV